MSTRWVGLLISGWVALACAPRPGAYAAPASNEQVKPRLGPAGAPTQLAASTEMLVELSGRRVSVSGEVAGAEPQALQRALTKHGNGASVVLLRARPEADLTMLKEVLNALPPVNAPKLVIDIGDVHLEMTRPGAGRADHRPATTLIAQVNTRRRLWRVDNVSGTFEDLGSWTAGDDASEQDARGKLQRACGGDCRIILDLADTPIIEALRIWQRIGRGLNGSLAVDYYEMRRPAPGLEPERPATATPSPAGGARVRLGATTVSGHLSPMLIQAIIRSHFDRFRACYEAGLGRNPELRGRVQARFVIARDGSVSNVADDDSTMPDTEVRDCVLASFRKLTFPPPTGGIVTVVYPIQLEPG